MIGRVLALVAGLVAIGIVLLTPLEEMAERLLSVHMVNHEVLIFVAAPLLAFAVEPWVNAPIVPRLLRGVVRWLTRPVLALFLSTAALWLWHFPAAYDLALAREPVHALEHATFLGGFIVLWWPLVERTAPRRLATPAGRVLYLVVSATQASLLGALIAFGSSVLYPFYAPGGGAGSASALDDQHLAGMVMLLSGAVVYLVATVLATRERSPS